MPWWLRLHLIEKQSGVRKYEKESKVDMWYLVQKPEMCFGLRLCGFLAVLPHRRWNIMFLEAMLEAREAYCGGHERAPTMRCDGVGFQGNSST